jgi:SAM-dependent methyltransferase
MTRTHRDYVDANRAAWNASAPHHRRAAWYEGILKGFAKPGHLCLDDILTGRLLALDVAGKDVAQLCCNNGREILSVKNLGAGTCVGFDQAGAFLEQAEEFRATGGIDCRFVETDVYRVPSDFDASFDIVLITIGVLGWMPDLPGFFAVASRLLRPRWCDLHV